MTQNSTPASGAAAGNFDLGTAVQSFNDVVTQAKGIATKLTQLSTGAAASPPAPEGVFQNLGALVNQTDQGLSVIHQASVQQHQLQINQVQALADQLSTTLQDPGLDPATKASVQSLLNVRQAQLVQLNMQLATAYGDLLTPADVSRIQNAVAAAQSGVQTKKTAAEAVGIAMSIADTALFIAGTLAKAAII